LESGWIQELLNWLTANPGWGWALVFLVAFLESLVLIGILLPGIMILFGVGALIGLDVMAMIPIWFAASAGALLGDGLSYALGRRFGEHLLDIWPFSRYPQMMERGREFFGKHGSKSVIAGRFIGPLRPIIPAVVGMMGMTPGRFIAADIAACITWAPSFLLPGILFGASLEVASEYTGRLTIMLVILVVVLWATWWTIRSAYEPLATRSARWLRHAIRWTRRHPLLGKISGPILEPSQPEVLSVSVMALFLVIIFWGFVMLLFLSPFSVQPQALDQAVSDLALALRNHLADPVVVAISQFSHWPVLLLPAAAILLWLIGAGRSVAAAHWLIAVIGGILIQAVLSWTLRATPQVLDLAGSLPADMDVRGPSTAMSLATVVLTFFAIMEARELSRRHRQWPYLIAALLITLLTLARLYLGLEWLSGALMGIMLGLAWATVIGIAYRQRAFRTFSGGIASAVFYGVLFVVMVWQAQVNSGVELEQLRAARAQTDLSMAQWWTSGWQALPADRTGVTSVSSRKFNAQIAASPARVADLLSEAGWEMVPPSDWQWFIRALNPEPDQASLPLLGRSFEGRSESLLMRSASIRPGQLLTLRMWDSGFRISPDGQTIYLAQLVEEQLVQRLHVFSYWSALPPQTGDLERAREILEPLVQKQVSEGLWLMAEGEPGGRK
jgi:membrane protein DedA with SNARE-associated domain